MKGIYREQIDGLLDGGVDFILIETVFDTLNAKAAIVAADEAGEARGEELPVMVSMTLTDLAGRNLSGQTVEAFWHSVRHAKPLTMGLNCSFGATELHPYVNALNPQVDGLVCVYPNAGLPNELGAYDEPPEMTAKLVKGWAENGWLNVVGGCCGTTPAHIKAIAEAVKGVKPRQWHALPPALRLSGMEAASFSDVRRTTDSVQRATFINIGERTNVTGSARFKKLILEGDYTAAVEVARQQVESGAQIIDVNMDEGLLDSELAMDTFLKLIAVGARHRPRADHDRQLQVERDRGRPEMRRRQADRQLDLHEGRHRAVHRARPQGAPLRRRRRGHGVRREGPGRHQGAQGRDLRHAPTTSW